MTLHLSSNILLCLNPVSAFLDIVWCQSIMSDLKLAKQDVSCLIMGACWSTTGRATGAYQMNTYLGCHKGRYVQMMSGKTYLVSVQHDV